METDIIRVCVCYYFDLKKENLENRIVIKISTLFNFTCKHLIIKTFLWYQKNNNLFYAIVIIITTKKIGFICRYRIFLKIYI